MNIHEHQAKELLKSYGAPVSNGIVIHSITEIPEKIKLLKFVKKLDVILILKMIMIINLME